MRGTAEHPHCCCCGVVFVDAGKPCLFGVLFAYKSILIEGVSSLILKDRSADREFKTQFAACVTENELRVRDLLLLLRAQQNYEPLGHAFLLTSQGEVEKADLEVRRGYQAAVDLDRASLFALADILKLLPSAKNGLVTFADLPPQLLHRRVSLFHHLN